MNNSGENGNSKPQKEKVKTTGIMKEKWKEKILKEILVCSSL